MFHPNWHSKPSASVTTLLYWTQVRNKDLSEATVLRCSYVAQWNLFAPTVRRVRVFRHPRRMLVLRSPAQPSIEPPPRVNGLATPDPEPGRDAHHQTHKVLEHEDGVVWRHVLRLARADAAALPA